MKALALLPKSNNPYFIDLKHWHNTISCSPHPAFGLSLVRELIELHHGNIQVKSEPGSGSEFIVTLPKEKKHLQTINKPNLFYPTVTIIHRRYKLLKKIRIVHPSRQHTQRMKIKPTQRMKNFHSYCRRQQ